MKIKLVVISVLFLASCTINKGVNDAEPVVINTNINTGDKTFEINFYKGEAHNHPTFSFWIETLEGDYLQTLYVTQYVAKGVFGHGQLEDGKWDSEPGEARRPATLPYFLHKRGVMNEEGTYLPTPDQPVPDAITAPTPKRNFKLNAGVTTQLPQRFKVLMEINQAFDWNEYWNNTMDPGNHDYFNSGQPALVYSVEVDLNSNVEEYYLNPVGHSHPAGENGHLFTNITTLSTAKNIVEKVVVRLN